MREGAESAPPPGKIGLTKILLPKGLVLTYSMIAKVMHYQILFPELKSIYLLLNYVQFYLGSHFLN